MLRFNQLPPQIPEDVEFTRAGHDELCQPTYGYEAKISRMRTGETLGRVILANVGEDPEPELISAIQKRLTALLPAESPAAIGLRNGLHNETELAGEVVYV